MKQTTYLTTVLVLLLFATSVLWAQPMKKMTKVKKGNFIELNLTDQQEEQMEQLKFAHQEEMIEIKAEIQKNKLEMKKLLSSDGYSKSKLMELVKTENELESRAKLSRMEMWTDVYQFLDAEQKEVWTKHFHRKLEKHPRYEMRDHKLRKHRMMDRAERRER